MYNDLTFLNLIGESDGEKYGDETISLGNEDGDGEYGDETITKGA